MHVLEQQRLILLDDDGRGGVLRKHRNPPLGDPGSLNNRLDLGGNVDELARRLRLDFEGFRPEGQATGAANPCLRSAVRAVENAENPVGRADSAQLLRAGRTCTNSTRECALPYVNAAPGMLRMPFRPPARIFPPPLDGRLAFSLPLWGRAGWGLYLRVVRTLSKQSLQ